MDIVGYSKLVIDKQTEFSSKLNEITRNSGQFPSRGIGRNVGAIFHNASQPRGGYRIARNFLVSPTALRLNCAR
jgi:hypothetical protein